MELKTRSQGAYAQVTGARLYYEERGAGYPLVFIPGGSVDASHYATVADRLTDEFRTVTFVAAATEEVRDRRRGMRPALPNRPTTSPA